MDEIDNR